MESLTPVIARIGIRVLTWLSAAAAAAPLGAQPTEADAGVRGYWQEPSGAVIQIAPCTEGLCLKIVALPAGDHPHNDVYNPDRGLRGRPLCGLSIGRGFAQTDARHADGGHLYDPKSGRTYSGSMSAEGNTLRLRGYVGISLFGRTETWSRVGPEHVTCASR